MFPSLKTVSRQLLSLLGGALIATTLLGEVKVVPELKTLQDTYDDKLKDTLKPYEAGVADLKAKYLAALERALDLAMQEGKLEDALALKAETQSSATGKIVVPPQDGPKTPLPLKQLHEAYRTAITKLDQDLAKSVNPLRKIFSTSLGALITSLTKEGKLEEAVVVKKTLDKLPVSHAPLPSSPPKPTAATVAIPVREAIGSDWGKPFKESHPQSMLLGFVLSYGKDRENTVIQSAQPIWGNAGSEFKGHTYGKPHGPPIVIKARPGFAVGSLAGRGGTKVDNFQITFMKIKVGELDPQESYKSEWLGGVAGLDMKTLSGNGKPVIGIFGGSGDDLNSLGLVFQ